jgi:palmitoyltransferase
MVRAGSWCDRCLDATLCFVTYCKCVTETLIRYVGPLFVVIAFTLIYGGIYIFFAAVFPFQVPEPFSLYGALHLAWCAFLFQGLMFNYLFTIITPPGAPPPPTNVSAERLAQLESERAPRRGEGFSRWCKKCKAPKPERTHHCHVCRRCVMKMDHHCPWVNNCVGHFNHRYFVLFLLYLFLVCAYGAIMSYTPFMESHRFAVPWIGLSARGTIVLIFVLSVAVGMAVGLMLAWHIYLVLTGQTTIEFYFNRYRMQTAKERGETYHNEFDLGYRRNWEFFFGKGRFWFSWMLPALTPPPGDGVTYPIRTDGKTNSRAMRNNYSLV